MLWRLVAAGTAVLSAPLLAQGTAPAPPTAAELASAASPGEKEQAYILNVREADTYEIEASRLALQRSRNRQIRSFAQMMISHHTRSGGELAKAAPSATPLPARELREPKSQMLDKLRSSSTQGFEANYTQGQIAAHEEALQLHRDYASSGATPELRAFATRAAALVERHLSRARGLRPLPR